ncbi:YbhB/YbcL family Raf kinase inhibitor-like protein [Oleidesulfovibrio sp.]|uniref:YbhB/YbcL family Raf kinase inhibitor-like protein n=1 Tax=Oleidesulfovibrio sp. TaxID=2909707 RepID=UPI003A87ED30
MKLHCPAFVQGETLPEEMLASGGISPALEWDNAPEGTGSFVILCDDPDAEGGTRTLWMIYNLPADMRTLEAGVIDDFTPMKGASHGLNENGKCRYDGPEPSCHPRRVHFRLYALDKRLPLKAGAARGQLLRAMEGHVIAEARITGLVECRR